MNPSHQHHIVGVLAPTLHSNSGETIAFHVAVALSEIASVLAGNPKCMSVLGAATSSELRGSGNVNVVQGSLDSYDFPSRLPARLRQSVALLWVQQSGSWASAVVVSTKGHLLTCAHFVTGSSWMEPEAGSTAPDELSTHPEKQQKSQRQAWEGR